MGWSRISDGLCWHPKALAAGNEALGAWVRALSWVAHPDHQTDGLIPAAIVAQLAPPRVWRRLAEAGMVEPDGKSYRIHDYLAWNPSAAESRARREAWADRQRKSREIRSMSRRDMPVTHGGVTESRPVPSRPSEIRIPVAPLPGGPAAGDWVGTLPDEAGEPSQLGLGLDSPSPTAPSSPAAPSSPPRKAKPRGETAADRYARAYAAGVGRALDDAHRPLPERSQRSYLGRMAAAYARGADGELLTGDDVVAWVEALGAAYATDRREHRSFEDGFSPRKAAAWLQARGGKVGAPTATTSGAPQPPRVPASARRPLPSLLDEVEAADAARGRRAS